MSNKKDLMSLGQAYGDVLNRVVIREEKLPVPAGEVGEAPLESGGPEEKAGFRPSKIDITKMSDKDKEDNIYNIKGYTYGDGNNPGNTNQPDPTGPEFDQVPYSGIVGPEEDEETLSIYDNELLKAVKGYKNPAGKALLERAQQEMASHGGLSAETRQALSKDFQEEDEEQLVEWVWQALTGLGRGALWAMKGLKGAVTPSAKAIAKKRGIIGKAGSTPLAKGVAGGAAIEGGLNLAAGLGQGHSDVRIPKDSPMRQPDKDPSTPVDPSTPPGMDWSKLAIPAAVVGGLALASKKKKKKKSKNEEEEEFLAEHEKIARAGLNNFMSKSVFDKLYNKVMVNEEFDEVEDIDDLEALGIETDEVVDEVPEEITVSIPGDLAQALCDILQTALAQQETEVDIDVDVEAVEDTDFEEDAETANQKRYGGNKGDHPRRFNKKTGRKSEVRDYEGEEDEEAQMKDGGGYGIDAGSTYTKEVNYGKKNRVGRLRPATGLVQKDGGGYGVDAGSTLSKEVNYARKNNKVGNMKLGNIPGA